MAVVHREQRVAEIFAELAGLSGDGDENRLLPLLADRCVELLGVAAAGVALFDPDGRPGSMVGTATDGGPVHRRRSAVNESVLPIRARGQVVGSLALVGKEPGRLSDTQLQMAQALADAAGSAILFRRELRRSETLTDQLQQALSSRVLIEQAKGILAERWQIGVAEAFRLLREHARARSLPLREVAGAVIQGEADQLLAGLRPPVRDGDNHPA